MIQQVQQIKMIHYIASPYITIHDLVQQDYLTRDISHDHRASAVVRVNDLPACSHGSRGNAMRYRTGKPQTFNLKQAAETSQSGHETGIFPELGDDAAMPGSRISAMNFPMCCLADGSHSRFKDGCESSPKLYTLSSGTWKCHNSCNNMQ